MAAYCSSDDLADLLPTVTFSTTTTPSSTQVTTYCDLISYEIDGMLRSRGVTTPVTDSDALAYLQTVSLYGVAAMALAAKFGSDAAAAVAWETRYRDCLAAIRDGAVTIDAAVDAAGFGEGFTLDADGEAREPFITRAMEW